MADSPRDPAMDAKSLYREEIYTDRKMGTLRVMLPVTASGEPDSGAPDALPRRSAADDQHGPAADQLRHRGGARSPTRSRSYGEAAKVGVEQALRELQEMRRQASSSLVIPPAGAASALTGGGGSGGLGGGGGKIQLP